MSEKIRIEFTEHVYDKVRQKTELVYRANPDIGREVVVVKRDAGMLQGYFDQFADEFRNDAGITHRSKANEGYFSFDLSEVQTTNKLSDLKGLLISAAVEYVLACWFKDLGIGSLYEFRKSEYERFKTKFINNSTEERIIQPAYRPYF